MVCVVLVDGLQTIQSIFLSDVPDEYWVLVPSDGLKLDTEPFTTNKYFPEVSVDPRKPTVSFHFHKRFPFTTHTEIEIVVTVPL